MIKDFKTYIEESRLGRILDNNFSDELRKEDKDVVDLGLPSGILWCKENFTLDDKSWFSDSEMMNGKDGLFKQLHPDEGFFVPDENIVNELKENTETIIEDDRVIIKSKTNNNCLIFNLESKSYDIYHYEGFWVYDEKYGFVEYVLSTGHLKVPTDTKINARIRLVKNK